MTTIYGPKPPEMSPHDLWTREYDAEEKRRRDSEPEVASDVFESRTAPLDMAGLISLADALEGLGEAMYGACRRREVRLLLEQIKAKAWVYGQSLVFGEPPWASRSHVDEVCALCDRLAAMLAEDHERAMRAFRRGRGSQ
jgi:hypothetical protein